MTLKVAIPVLPEKTEWKLNGQMLTLTLPLSETISNLKAKLQDETNMAPAKQKLFYDVSFEVVWCHKYFMSSAFRECFSKIPTLWLITT